jgi:hypothetical protein
MRNDEIDTWSSRCHRNVTYQPSPLKRLLLLATLPLVSSGSRPQSRNACGFDHDTTVACMMQNTDWKDHLPIGSLCFS